MQHNEPLGLGVPEGVMFHIVLHELLDLELDVVWHGELGEEVLHGQ